MELNGANGSQTVLCTCRLIALFSLDINPNNDMSLKMFLP